MLETSNRHWAAKEVAPVANVSNGLSLATDWTRGARDLTPFAVAQGWWAADAGRVDFAAAYADETGVPPNQCVERRRRAAAFLAEGRGQLTPAALRTLLRDHYDAGTVQRARPFDDPFFFSICMHADPLDNTTASMVAALPPTPDRPASIGVSLGSPCVGAFVPVWLEAPVPAVLARGSGEPDDDSPWWRMRALLDLVERDVATYGPMVRARWDLFETGVWRDAGEVERNAARREGAARSALLGDFSAHVVERWLAELAAVAAAIR